MKKLIYIVFWFLFIWLNYTFASVNLDAWSSYSVWINQTVYLTWEISWANVWCNIVYSWTEVTTPTLIWIDIQNSWSINASFIAPSVSVWTSLTIQLEANVSWCADAGVYSDTTYITIDLNIMTVNAWSDIVWTVWDTITLTATWYWWYCLNKIYNWSQTWSVLSPDLFDETNSNYQTWTISFIAPSVSSTTVFLLWVDFGCGYGTTWTDYVQLTIYGNSSQTNQPKRFEWRNSYKPFLERNLWLDLPLVHFRWNSMGWDWLVNYAIQISKDESFLDYETINTTDSNLYTFSNLLNQKWDVLYIRFRAEYWWNYSDYSNIIVYYSNFDPLKLFKVKKKQKIYKNSYNEIIDLYSMLDSSLRIKSKKIINKIKF